MRISASGIRAAIGALALGLLIAAPAALAAEERTLTVVGRAELRVAPDVAVAVLTVTTRAKRAEDASVENARRSRAVLAQVRAEIGRADRAETLHYRIQPVYEYPKGGPRELVGFEVVNSLRVRTHELDRIGTLLDRVTAAADVSVDSLSFELDDPRATQAKVLEMAGRDARRRAEHIAEGVGVTLRRVRTVREAGASRPPPPRPMMDQMRSAEAAPTEILPQELQVSEQIEVTYEIQ